MGFELRKEFFRGAEPCKPKNHHTYSIRISRLLEPVLSSTPEDKMANRARWTYGASFLVLSLIVSPAAFAAAENTDQEKTSQAQPDSRSYLPPWMQGQGSGDKASASANTAVPSNTSTTESKSAAADNEPVRKRVRAGSQVQRSRPRTAPAGDVFGGLAGLFGGR